MDSINIFNYDYKYFQLNKNDMPLKIICKKSNIDLLKNNNDNYFILVFTCNNINVIFKKLINFSLYKLIGDINSNILEKIEIVNIIKDDEEVDILFLFKELVMDLGIGKKYMHIRTVKRIIDNNTIIFNSYDVPYDKSNELEKNGYTKITSDISNLKINFENENKINVLYGFKIDINEPIPIYMQNITGIIMKKIFINLKHLFESI
jgi:hypothetical protein